MGLGIGQREAAGAGVWDSQDPSSCLEVFHIRRVLPSICARQKKPAHAAPAFPRPDKHILSREHASAATRQTRPAWLHPPTEICRTLPDNPLRLEQADAPPDRRERDQYEACA